MRKSIWQRVKPWCVPLVLTLLIYIMLRSVFLIGYVPSASMEPTLHEGSFILGLRLYSEPKVGDIIIFEKDGVLLVKRIAACPGDSVDLSQLEYMMSTPIPVWEEAVLTVPVGVISFSATTPRIPGTHAIGSSRMFPASRLLQS